jgi:hypothetical protein
MTETKAPEKKDQPTLIVEAVIVEIRKAMVEKGVKMKTLALALDVNPRQLSYAFGRPHSFPIMLLVRIADQLNINAAAPLVAVVGTR